MGQGVLIEEHPRVEGKRVVLDKERQGQRLAELLGGNLKIQCMLARSNPGEGIGPCGYIVE